MPPEVELDELVEHFTLERDSMAVHSQLISCTASEVAAMVEGAVRHGTARTPRATTCELGQRCADAGIEVVCGGARVGLMGIIARSVAASGGQVCGVLPRFLAELEPSAPELTELVTVETMHERKAAIAARADAFLVLPGGLGTLEEAFEIMTLRQLNEHEKNIVFLNVGGYYDPLAEMFVSMEECGFFILQGRKTLQVANDLDSAWQLLDL